jgi:hypothetical protein
MPNLLDQLREQRAAARAAADEILTRAADQGRDLTPDEVVAHREQVEAERAASDRIEEAHAAEPAELRAAQRAGRGAVLSRQALDTARAFRSAIFSKSPAPIAVYSDLPDEWPDDLPSRSTAAWAGCRSTPVTPSRAPRPRRSAPTCTPPSSATWSKPPASCGPARRC